MLSDIEKIADLRQSLAELEEMSAAAAKEEPPADDEWRVQRALDILWGTDIDTPSIELEYDSGRMTLEELEALAEQWAPQKQEQSEPYPRFNGPYGEGETHEQALERYKEEEATAKPTAVLITGNPKWVKDNTQAEAFYAQIESYLQVQGWQITRDPGDPHTSPPPADLWIGHSRGVDRLRFAPEGTRTISLGAAGGINHPKDTAMEPGDIPTEYHYMLTEEMQQAFDGAWKDVSPTPDDDNILEELLRAKEESDRGNYGAKHEILRRLIIAHPEQFILDSEENGIYGITHIPSGFQIHILQKASPTELARPIYHGSSLGDIKQLDPRTHRLSDRPVVFATPHEELALSMSLPASQEELAMGFEEDTATGARTFYIDELQPGKLELLNKPSFLYDLHPSTFSEEGLHPNLMREERISYDPVKPFRAPRPFKSALQELRDRGVRIRAYDDVPADMWSTKAGGFNTVLSAQDNNLLNAVLYDSEFIKQAARDWSVGVGGGVRDVTKEDVNVALEDIERMHGYPHPKDTSVAIGKMRPFHALKRSLRPGSLLPSGFSDIGPTIKRNLGALGGVLAGGAETLGPHFSPYSNMVRFGRSTEFRGEQFPSTLAHEIRHYRQHLVANQGLKDEELESTYGTMLPAAGYRHSLFKTMRDPKIEDIDKFFADWMAIEIDSNVAGRQGLDPKTYRRHEMQEVLPQTSYFMNVANAMDQWRDSSHPADAPLRQMVPASDPKWKKTLTTAWLKGDQESRWTATKSGLMHGMDILTKTFPKDYINWKHAEPQPRDYESQQDHYDAWDKWAAMYPANPITMFDGKMIWTRSDQTIPELSKLILNLEYQRRLGIRANLKKAAGFGDITQGNPTWQGILAGTPGERYAQEYSTVGSAVGDLKNSFFRRPSEPRLWDPAQGFWGNLSNFFEVPIQRREKARSDRRSFHAIQAAGAKMQAATDRGSVLANIGTPSQVQDSPWGKQEVGPGAPGVYSRGGFLPRFLQANTSATQYDDKVGWLNHMMSRYPGEFQLESSTGDMASYAHKPSGLRFDVPSPGTPATRFDVAVQQPNFDEWATAMNLSSGRTPQPKS